MHYAIKESRHGATRVFVEVGDEGCGRVWRWGMREVGECGGGGGGVYRKEGMNEEVVSKECMWKSKGRVCVEVGGKGV